MCITYDSLEALRTCPLREFKASYQRRHRRGCRAENSDLRLPTKVTCIDTLVKKTSPMQCAHCDAKLTSEKKKPIVALKREGTGYAAGGQAEAKRSDLAFQA